MPPEQSAAVASATGVLIVDDQQPVTRALSVLLRNAGFDPHTCHSGGEALAYSESHRPAAAVVDIHLPDINGLILVQMLRNRFGATFPIIVVSGDTSMETIKSLSHVGATYFFSKPISPGALVEKLKTLLAGGTRVAS